MNDKIRNSVAAARRWVAALGPRPKMLAAFLLPLVVAGLLVAGLGQGGKTAEPAGTREFSKDQRQAINAMIRAYLLEHPEIIPEAISRMQEREVAKLLDSNREEIETPFAGAWAGNPQGDVVLVEFFDYACPYCRLARDDVQRLLREDKDLKVVYRDFPVLSPASEEAALASLSAAAQGRYTAFYNRLLGSEERVTRERIIAAVRAAGLNEYRTARDMRDEKLKAEVTKNRDLGRALGLTGTPSYVIGDRILSGAVGYDQLKQAIAEARARSQG